MRIVRELEDGETALGTVKKFSLLQEVMCRWQDSNLEGGIYGRNDAKQKYAAEFKLYAIEIDGSMNYPIYSTCSGITGNL